MQFAVQYYLPMMHKCAIGYLTVEPVHLSTSLQAAPHFGQTLLLTQLNLEPH